MLSYIQGSLLITHFIALRSFLRGSLQKVTDTISLCLIISQLLHDLTLQIKNALCNGVQGALGLWWKITSLTFQCLAVL